MAEDIIIVKEDALRKMTMKRLLEVGVPQKDAEVVTDVLVYADLRGVYSHGVIRVEHYMNRIRRGGINLKPTLEVKSIKPSIGLLDAQGGLGHVATKLAAEYGIKTAAKEGVAVVGVKNNSHCGALAYYVQMAMDAGKAAIVLSNTDIRVVPFGGRDAFFGTNPFAFGFPGTKESILLDMATSEIAWGKVLTAREKGQTLKEGWAVDKNGSSTTDPHQAQNLTPFGGPKGYGINLLVETLSGVLIGGIFGPHLNRMYEDLDSYRDLSTFILILDPAVFGGGKSYLETAQRMIDEIHALPAAPGVEKVLLPGEIESRTMKHNKANGIPVPKSIYDFMAK
jgi:ureidoglycolate dehydrogenase (NAD+)